MHIPMLYPYLLLSTCYIVQSTDLLYWSVGNHIDRDKICRDGQAMGCPLYCVSKYMHILMLYPYLLLSTCYIVQSADWLYRSVGNHIDRDKIFRDGQAMGCPLYCVSKYMHIPICQLVI